jgi:DNA-binding transcriptional LysR family regulator
VSGAELSHTPLVLGDGLRAAMDALLAGRGIELKVEIEVNDHETIRLMVQHGAAASILPYSSVARECAQGLLDAHRIAEGGIFRTLALGVRASRTASLARETVVRTITRLVGEIEEEGRLSITTPHHRRSSAPTRAAPAPSARADT